jgi:hypothetical protein
MKLYKNIWIKNTHRRLGVLPIRKMRLSASIPFNTILLTTAGASGKNVVWMVFPFAPQAFIRGKRTHVVR